MHDTDPAELRYRDREWRFRDGVHARADRIGMLRSMFRVSLVLVSTWDGKNVGLLRNQEDVFEGKGFSYLSIA